MLRMKYITVFCLSAIALFTQSAQSQEADSPFCLWPQAPMIDRDHARQELPYIQDLGVRWLTVPAFPLDFNQQSVDSDWSETALSFDVYEGTDLIVAPVSEDPTAVPIQEFYDAVISAANRFPQTQYWMFYTEIDPPFSDPIFIQLIAKKWALYTRIGYKALKEVCSDCLFGGPGTGGSYRSYLFAGQDTSQNYDGFFVEYMRELQWLEEIENNPSSYDWSTNPLNLTQEEFDIIFSADTFSRYFDIHHYSNFDSDFRKYYKSTEQLADAIKSLMSQFDYGNVALWLTQTATHTGEVISETSIGEYQTESEQAGYLIKKYVLSIALGIEKIFWTGPFEMGWSDSMEFGGPPNYQHFFSQVGLIYDGNGIYDPGSPFDPDEIKKLSYYTFKKMTQSLEGSDWDSVQAVSTGVGNVYAYQFNRATCPVYVAWWDYFADSTYTTGDSMLVDLTIGDIDSVRIIQAVPDAENGADLDENDYPNFFAGRVEPVVDGVATIELGENPVFAEGISSLVSIENEIGRLAPKELHLSQNYPNPFNSITTIEYRLPLSDHVTLRILNVLGEEVRMLVNQNKSAGNYSVIWDGKNKLGRELASGIYFYQLKIVNSSRTKKLLFLR